MKTSEYIKTLSDNLYFVVRQDKIMGEDRLFIMDSSRLGNQEFHYGVIAVCDTYDIEKGTPDIKHIYACYNRAGHTSAIEVSDGCDTTAFQYPPFPEHFDGERITYEGTDKDKECIDNYLEQLEIELGEQMEMDDRWRT